MSSLKLNNILAIFLVASLARFEPSLGFYLGRRHLHIVNWLDNQEPLMVRCWCNGGSLGTHNLKYKEEFRWEFLEIIPFQLMKIECDMEFNDGGKPRRGHFVVFDSTQEVRRRECYKWCNWSVGIYGLYAYDEVDERWDYEIPWPSKNTF
ncbi:Plant self-incompatibility protein S1 family, putative [Theobroma cacao]|uniref:S-protein homolog n=1 Tax=Theobroma cacao TaxID=3641 RepID=A0A061GXG6_THECC|nr:Plant self-incompatibility protein S1 family, putative [Theobroma cacao]